MQKNAYAFAGSIIHEDDVPNTQVSYRWHLPDPVRFQRRIKVTIETGHANHLRDDTATTAYWYQTLPGPKLALPPVEKRLVRRPILPTSDVSEVDVQSLSPEKKAMALQREERFKEYLADRQVWVDRRAKDSQARAIKKCRDCRGYQDKVASESQIACRSSFRKCMRQCRSQEVPSNSCKRSSGHKEVVSIRLTV